jgi:hypothetical protein
MNGKNALLLFMYRSFYYPEEKYVLWYHLSTFECGEVNSHCSSFVILVLWAGRTARNFARHVRKDIQMYHCTGFPTLPNRMIQVPTNLAGPITVL